MDVNPKCICEILRFWTNMWRGLLSIQHRLLLWWNFHTRIVPFIASLSIAALSRRNHASAGTLRDGCSAHGHHKRDFMWTQTYTHTYTLHIYSAYLRHIHYPLEYLRARACVCVCVCACVRARTHKELWRKKQNLRPRRRDKIWLMQDVRFMYDEFEKKMIWINCQKCQVRYYILAYILCA